MAVQFSHQFHRHWLAAPASTRRKIKDDLKGIVELLKPETKLADWQKQHGIYHNDTTKAEQVGLFDTEAESQVQAADSLPRTQSSFLNKVTQSEKVDVPHTIESIDNTGSAFEGVQFSTKQVEPNADSSVSMENSTKTSNIELAQEQAELLADIEQKVDEYLQMQTAQTKSEIMQWAKQYIADNT